MERDELVAYLRERGYELAGGGFRTRANVAGKLFAYLIRKDLTVTVAFPTRERLLPPVELADRLADEADKSCADKYHQDMGDMQA